MSPRPTLLDRSLNRAGRHADLALVPAVASLLAVDEIAKVLAPSRGFSLKFPLPPTLPTLWNWASSPGGGVTVAIGGPVWFLPVSLVLTAVLAAGYLAGVHAAVTGRERSFADGVRALAVPVLVVRLVELALFLPAAGLALLSPAFVVLVVPYVAAVGYALWGAPFLVAEGYDALAALRRSARFAAAGGRYGRFALGFVAVSALASVPLSFVVQSLGVPGLLVGLVAFAYPALVGSLASMDVIHAIERDWRRRDAGTAPGSG